MEGQPDLLARMGYEHLRANFNQYLELARAVTDQSGPTGVESAALTGALLGAASVPAPAIQRAVLSLARHWASFDRAQMLRITILDGVFIMIPDPTGHAIGGRMFGRVFRMVDMVELPENQPGPAIFYMVLDVTHLSQMVEASHVVSDVPPGA